MSYYRQGREVEYATCHDLKDNGYDIIRGSSSKGFADIVAIKPGQALHINVKKTKPPSPADRAYLIDRASWIGALPLVALGPASKLTYRRLTGPGPADWEPWTPDEIGRPTDRRSQ